MNGTAVDLYDAWPLDEYLWLPSGNTWQDVYDDIDASEIDCRPLMRDCLLWTIYFLVGRTAFHCLVGLPLCYLCGVYKPGNTQRNLLIVGIEEYFTNRLKGKSFKFIDAAYRWVFYVSIFSYAYYYLTTMPANIAYYDEFIELWNAFPEHVSTVHMRRHYVIEVGYYMSALLIGFKNDIGRKDFLINTVHHIVTLFLLYMSWTLNGIRVGTIILLLHDAADGFIEFSKMAIYATENDIYPNTIMVFFLLVWCYTRMYIFPQVIWSGLVDAQQVIASTTFPIMGMLLIGLLCVLQVLHCIWTALIVRIIRTSLQPGGKTKDERSESEGEEEDDPKTTKSIVNGTTTT